MNCAGFSVPGRAYQMSDYDVKKMMDVNYLGSVKMTQALLPEMITHREGAIIFTSSVGGLIGIYGLAAYCGSKFAVRGYAEALAMGTVFLSAMSLPRTSKDLNLSSLCIETKSWQRPKPRQKPKS